MSKNFNPPQPPATLTCRVTPNARKTEILGWGSDEKGRPVLMIKLSAPPVEGKANEALQDFIADTLGCAKNQVLLIRGATNRVKVLQIPAGAITTLGGPAEQS